MQIIRSKKPESLVWKSCRFLNVLIILEQKNAMFIKRKDASLNQINFLNRDLQSFNSIHD